MLGTLTPYTLALRRKVRRAAQAAINYATTWTFATYAQANAGALPGPWAAVRRTGTATYTDAAGLIQTLPDLGGGTYAARVEYSAGTARGLLIEGQATQLQTTQQLSAATWAKNAVTATADPAVAAPDGSQAVKFKQGSGFSQHFAYRTITFSATAYITRTFYVRGGDAGAIIQLSFGAGQITAPADPRLNIDPAAGTITAVDTGIAASIAPWRDGWHKVVVTFAPSGTAISEYWWHVGSGTAARFAVMTGNGTTGAYVWHSNTEAGTVATSHIPNSGTGTVVRAADSAGVFLTSTALSAAFPSGVTAPWTTVFQYRKGYSVSSDETLFALSAGSSAGSTNLLALQTNGTQAQAVHSGGSGTLSGTLVHDGATVNKVAVSVDPVSGKVSVSVNGAAAVETTGIAFTGSGTTHLIPGARTTGGSTPVLGMEIYDWRNVNTSYTTGASLQALSA